MDALYSNCRMTSFCYQDQNSFRFYFYIGIWKSQWGLTTKALNCTRKNPHVSEIAYFLSRFMWPPLWRAVSKQCIAPCNGIRIPECGKFLFMESGILGFGIRNTAQGIRNHTNDCNLESKFYWQRLESSTWNPESKAWNPESRTVLDSLKGGEMRYCKGLEKSGFHCM